MGALWHIRCQVEGLESTRGAAAEVETRAELASQLSLLRSRSGLTVRELASRLGVPAATLGGYFSGRHLPGASNLELFRAVLRECGVGPEDLKSWVDALARARASSDRRVALPSAPYRGLEPYRSEDAALFCGREEATAEVLDRLRALLESPAPRSLLVVVGASGSGKSSLVRAGVVPAVQAGALDGPDSSWSAQLSVPGPVALEALSSDWLGRGPGLRGSYGQYPSEAFNGQSGDGHYGGGGALNAQRLDGERLDGEPRRGRRLVVIDQFEEVFRLDASQRADLLSALSRAEPSWGAVVAVLRADFYEAAANEPVLLTALRSNQVLVGPMTEAEVREVITGPAQKMGVKVEPGLVELLLRDLAPRGPTGFAHDAGVLPLLSYALLATWQNAKGNELTVSAYRAAGGLHGAVRQRAEVLYLGLSPGQQVMARRLFHRLVNVEEGVPLTRRHMTAHEVDQLGLDAAEVLGRFVAARLVTADEGGVQVSHEALLYAWPRLAGWLDADRDGLRLHHELVDATKRWSAADRDPSLLLRGTRLAICSEWAAQGARGDELSGDEMEFLASGQAQEAAEKSAARRRSRRVKQLLAIVAALALVTSVLAGFALQARSDAKRVQNEALSRQVAIEATQLESNDPSLAMQLALAAYRLSPTVQARSALLDASASEMPMRLLGPVGTTCIALARRGQLLAVVGSASDKADLYALSDARPRLLARSRVGSPPNQTFTVALSPDGRLMAVGNTDGKVLLFTLSPLYRLRLLATLGGFQSTVYDVAFSPSGRSLVAASNDGTVRQWYLGQPSRPTLSADVRGPQGRPLQAVAYSPNGRFIAAGGADGTLLIWKASGGKPFVARGLGSAQVTTLAFSPNSKLLATGGEDDLVHLFSVARSGKPRSDHTPLRGFTSWVDSLAFSPDGGILVAGSSDNSIRQWSTANWDVSSVLKDTDPVTSTDFLPSGRELVTANSGGTVRFWPMPSPTSYLTSGPVFTIDYTGNGAELAAVSGGPHGDVALWDVADPWRPRHISDVVLPASFGPVAGVEAFSTDGRLLAVGDAAAQIQLVQLGKDGRAQLLGPPLLGASPPLEQLAFNQQGTLLASGDNSGRAHLWDISNPRRPLALSTLPAAGYLVGVAFSPNGQLLALASTDDKVWLWDISKARHPRLLAVLGGFASYAECVTFTPNGRTLIAGGADNTVRLWDVSDPRHPRLLGPPLTGPTSYVYSLSVSPDGKTLAASTVDSAVWLWDISSPAQPSLLATLGAATGQVFDVTFSPNNQTVVASGSDQRLTFWDYRPSRVAARICSLTGSPITRAEWAEYVQGAKYDPSCR